MCAIIRKCINYTYMYKIHVRTIQNINTRAYVVRQHVILQNDFALDEYVMHLKMLKLVKLVK